MRKLTAILMVLSMLVTVFAGCANPQPQPDEVDSDDKLKIVCTSFVSYDWTREILGERTQNFELVWLQSSGVDFHSYQPTAEDAIEITNSDLFIYTGGVSDDWVADGFINTTDHTTTMFNLVEHMGEDILHEVTVEGMQAEDAHDHEDEDAHAHEDEDAHDHEDEDAHDHEDEDAHAHEDEDAHAHEDEGHVDEHVWLSPKNAMKLVAELAVAISELDPEGADVYAANATAYTEELSALDADYTTATEGVDSTLIFADRFPFLYLTTHYDLDYYAAFPGCSAETEATFETITFLSDKTDELGTGVLLTVDEPAHRIAETVSENATKGGQEILSLDSMQAVSLEDAQGGATYITIMNKNLDILKKALG